MPAGLTYLLHLSDGTFAVHHVTGDIVEPPGTEVLPGWVTDEMPRIRRADDPYYNNVLIDFDVHVVPKVEAPEPRRWGVRARRQEPRRA